MPLVELRRAPAGQIEKTLGDIHKESMQEINKGKHQAKYLQLLIVIVPDVPGYYGE